MEQPETLAVDPALDAERLGLFLKEHAPQYAGSFAASRLGEGQSCLTYLLQGEGWKVVLRRPPRGDLPPTAFDVTREFRVMRALHGHQTGIPVARPILLCEDVEVIGAPFYLMETVDGLVVRRDVPSELSSLADRWTMGEELLDTLVRLRNVEYAAIGLEGFGKPEGYLERQLRRMKQLWELARFRDVPEIEEVGVWLEGNVPAQTTSSIVHGDYKLDNVIFAPHSPPKIVAVVDWEMSTLGDPLADLGWMLYFWRDPQDEVFGLASSQAMGEEGFMRRADLLTGYAERTGTDVGRVNWHAALAGWKIAIIMEGSYRRFLAGIGDHPTFAQLEQGVPALAQRAASAMRGELF